MLTQRLCQSISCLNALPAVPGTIQERGLHVWAKFMTGAAKWWEDEETYKVSFCT